MKLIHTILFFFVLSCSSKKGQPSRVEPDIDFTVSSIYSTLPDNQIIARIDYVSIGCFHKSESVFHLAKTRNDQLFATLYSEYGSRYQGLPKSYIDSLSTFLKLLKKTPIGGGCTTREAYNVRTQNETFKVVDDHCDGSKFYILQKMFFKDEFSKLF